jgi:AmmeMemoRadiSam system protein B
VLIGAGPQDAHADNVADALRPLLDPATLVVVSSDFTHFGRRFNFVPFRDDVAQRVEQLDRGAIERILAWDSAGFADYIARTAATVCGRNAIDVLLRLGDAPGAAELAAYDTSGRITGDWRNSVSYASLVFRRGAPT